MKYYGNNEHNIDPGEGMLGYEVVWGTEDGSVSGTPALILNDSLTGERAGILLYEIRDEKTLFIRGLQAYNGNRQGKGIFLVGRFLLYAEENNYMSVKVRARATNTIIPQEKLERFYMDLTFLDTKGIETKIKVE